MNKNIALPEPGLAEPKSKRGRFGEKPVLPPPEQALALPVTAPELVATGPALAPPAIAEGPPANFKVQAGDRPLGKMMEKERSKTRSGVTRTKAKKKISRAPQVMDDEVAVVARDPRRPRSE